MKSAFRLNIIGILWVLICFACNSNTQSHSNAENSKERHTDAVESSTPSNSNPTVVSGKEEDSDDSDETSGIQDGNYSATVDYDNPNTGYSATYTLSVEVSDGQVIQINFPNDGYLDEDHITAADLDDDGNAMVEGEDGKTYNVHIEP